MRTIDILIAGAPDVGKESAVAEHLVCTLAAELDVPIRISYSDRPQGATGDAGAQPEVPVGESIPVARTIFGESSALETDGLPEHDQTKYDLVVCLLWSRLPSVSAGKYVLPNGELPRSATIYETDSVIGELQRAYDVRRFRVYRNRATPDFPLEPKEEREEACRQWDAVQDFFESWEKDNEVQFRECCQGFLGLEEFANSFRQHFRNFLVEEVQRRTGQSKPPLQNRFWGLNPFRGLNFFDFEDAAFYNGRTSAIGDVLDALKAQTSAQKSLVLVLGPGGSGKSSLLRAGVLPLLIRGGTPVGKGPWIHVITRPSVGDPIDTLAGALADKFTLQNGARPDQSSTLASRLRQDPKDAASEVSEVLRETKVRLALLVDQLEELFIGISPVLQQKYITALCALARCERIHIIAALRSEFYPHYQRFPELVKLTFEGGKYELQPPTPGEIASMIRLPAETAGLRFERDSRTGRLEDALVKAATSSSDELPRLEHVLALLYNRQLRRKDGVLRWSDYFELGEFKNALAQHAEFVFSTLNRDEQFVFKSVIRQLLSPGASKERIVVRRSVPYHDLVSSPKLKPRQCAAARDLINRLTEEGLLSANPDAKHSRLISLPQDALLTEWPRLWRLISEDQHFFGMRERLDESLKLWLSRGEQNDHLLYDRIALAEGETLLRDFGPGLSESQIAYIQKSLAKQKRQGGARKYVLPAAIAAFGALAVLVVAQRFNSGSPGGQTSDVKSTQPDKSVATEDAATLKAQLKEAAEKVALAKQNAELADRQRTALEAELKTAEDKLSQLEDPELTDDKGRALQSKLKEAEDKVKQVRANSDETSSQLNASQVQLKEEQNKAQRAQATADSLASAQDKLQNQLKQAEANALAAQQKADIATNQRRALETQLKDAEEKLKLAQTNSGDAASQLSSLQAQLKLEQENEQKAQASADSLTSERNALQGQLKASEERLKLAQTNSGDAAGQLSVLQAQLKQEQDKEQKAQASADFLTSERNALQGQLKASEEKLKLAQTSSGDAASQLSVLQAQLKQEQEKEQKAQASADSLTSERDTLQSQLKGGEEKLKLAQTNSDDAASRLSVLQAQLKQEQDKGQTAQANGESLTGERSALQSQLKEAETKALAAQQNADLVSTQRDALETRLKDLEEKLKQTQSNSGAGASQVSALQTELKQEQQKEQKAQANNDSLTSERALLQTQLQQAESRALLAQEGAALAASERSALETRLKEAEEKINQAQLISGDTSKQLSASRAQLKQEQDKGKKAQANADSLTSERNALQSQVKQAEARALLAQQSADLASSQRSALEAQLKDAQEKLRQANASSSDTGAQLRNLQARLYAATPTSSTPLPPINALGTATPTESQFSQNNAASDDEASLKEFVLGYLRTVASNDTSVQRRYFADQVNFYGRGTVDASTVEASTEEYHREWPVRQWTPTGQTIIERSRQRDRFVVYQPFRWAVSDGSQNDQGNATLYLMIRRDSHGQFRIVRVRQIDR